MTGIAFDWTTVAQMQPASCPVPLTRRRFDRSPRDITAPPPRHVVVATAPKGDSHP